MVPAVATRVCANCGAQYLATVERCADCGEELVDGPDDEEAEEAGLGEEHPADQIAYELHEWANESRVTLDGMLTRQGIIHVWEAATLVVRADDEAQVDELVDEVEVSEQPTLDPDADQVSYEISGWDEAQRSDLEAALVAQDIPHGWDEDGDLVVLEEDEERVAPILDRIDMAREITAEQVGAADDDDDTAAGGATPDDGLAAQDTMSDLFVAADRLMNHPGDGDAIARLTDASERADALALPYGFSPAVWDDLKGKTAELRGLVAGGPDDDAVTEAATALRQTLRQYV